MKESPAAGREQESSLFLCVYRVSSVSTDNILMSVCEM
jgi:hypothetical protein